MRRGQALPLRAGASSLDTGHPAVSEPLPAGRRVFALNNWNHFQGSPRLS